MSDSKLALMVAGMTALVLALFVGATNFRALFPAHLSADIMPGQTWTVKNSDFSDIEIHSEYPVSVQEGPCYIPRTAEIRFRCREVSDLQIIDSRPALLIWARANHVTLTAR